MTYFLIAVIAALALLGIGWLLRFLYAGALMKQLEKAGEAVRFATFVRLEKRLTQSYGDQAAPLAVALDKELFSDEYQKPSPAWDFATSHPEIIEKELRALCDGTDLLIMVHTTLKHEIGLRWAYGGTPEAVESSFKKLQQNGLLVPTEPVDTKTYLRLAQTFYRDKVKS